MRTFRDVTEKERKDILEKHGDGQSTGSLAAEYGVKDIAMSNWLCYERNRQGEPKVRAAPVPQDVNDQIGLLTADYVTKLKALLLKEVCSNLKNMTL